MSTPVWLWTLHHNLWTTGCEYGQNEQNGGMAARGSRFSAAAGVFTDRRTNGGAPPSPPAARRATPRWRDPRLVVGLAVIAACALLGARLLATADDSVAVWAAGTDLNPGQRVTSADLVRTQVRFRVQADADRYLSADTALPAGTTVDRAVGTGELLARSALGDPATRSLTEVPLSVGTEAVPDTVGVGSTVDVWVTPRSAVGDAAAGTAAPGRSTRVFHDVRVVSAPATSTSLGPTATRQVIIGVAPDQEALLPRAIAALVSGDVLLTARR